MFFKRLDEQRRAHAQELDELDVERKAELDRLHVKKNAEITALQEEWIAESKKTNEFLELMRDWLRQMRNDARERRGGKDSLYENVGKKDVRLQLGAP
jgi:hypothetical protein